jgi:phage shock protein A
MSILTRFLSAFQARAYQLVADAEDPKANLDYSLARLFEIRNQMVRSLVDVSASRKRLEDQHNMLAYAVDKHQAQAEVAITAGREDLARIALDRKQEASSRLVEIDASLVSLDQQLENLKTSQANLDRKIALFQSKKEELKAIYDASRAQVRVREAVSGLSQDIADIGGTIQRAESRIREMQSRADAIDGLVAQGVLTDSLEPGRDDIDRELARIGRQQAIEDELARLKLDHSLEQRPGQMAQQLPILEQQPPSSNTPRLKADTINKSQE